MARQLVYISTSGGEVSATFCNIVEFPSLVFLTSLAMQATGERANDELPPIHTKDKRAERTYGRVTLGDDVSFCRAWFGGWWHLRRPKRTAR